MERYRLILAEEGHFSIVPMCRILGVSRSGYYGWRERGDSDRNARTASFDAAVRAAHLKSQMRYGSRRVQCELHEIGVACSRSAWGSQAPHPSSLYLHSLRAYRR